MSYWPRAAPGGPVGLKKTIAVESFGGSEVFGGQVAADGPAALLTEILMTDGRFVVVERAALSGLQSEQQLVTEALQMLRAERDDSLEGIRQGLADAVANDRRNPEIQRDLWRTRQNPGAGQSRNQRGDWISFGRLQPPQLGSVGVRHSRRLLHVLRLNFIDN